MQLPQIRSIGQHPIARRHVRDGSEHRERKNLRVPVVLVYVPTHRLRFGRDLERFDHIPARQKQSLQQIRVLEHVSRETESLGESDRLQTLQLHRLAVFKVPVQEH